MSETVPIFTAKSLLLILRQFWATRLPYLLFDGNVKYNIAEGTQTGTVFRLRGKGVKKLRRSDRGDQYVKVNIEVPKILTKSKKDLLREYEASMSESETENHYEKENPFLINLKKNLISNVKADTFGVCFYAIDRL